MFKIRDPKNLTEDEMLHLMEQDDPNFDIEYHEEEEVTSDVEETDHLSEHEDINDEFSYDEIGEDINVVPPEADDNSSDTSTGLPYYESKDGTKWYKHPVHKFQRRSLANKISATPGLTQYSSNISSIRESFLLFFTPDILEHIVNETNRKIRNFFDTWNSKFPDKPKRFLLTCRREIEAYIGLLITMGALQASDEPIEMLYNSDPAYNRPIFSAILSRNRYIFLTKFLRFDNFETREVRKETDKLAHIREIFDIFVSNCKKSLNPGTHLCVDEQIVPFRGRAPFRVYMKNKPSKYGLKVWALADCDTAYTVNMQVYLGKCFVLLIYTKFIITWLLGKQNNRPEVNQGQRVVLDLTDHLSCGYGITADNFFTSLQLSNKLWEKKLTLCGTLRKNKPFIPRELLPNPQKPLYSSMFAFIKNRTIVSYVPKKNHAVILLSSEHTDDKVNGEDVKYKPDIVLHYNSTKGAVDQTDQMAQKYTTQRRTLRWPMAMFYHLVDIAAINSFKIWSLVKPEYEIKHLDRRRKFLLDLGKEMARDHIIHRYENTKNLHADIKNNILKVIPELNQTGPREAEEERPKGQGRCHLCDRKKDRKTRKTCSKCDRFVCPEHSTIQVTCDACKKN